MVKKIIFLTGTRADFGKLKSLIEITRNDSQFEVYIFVTGMHLLPQYGYTVKEIEKCGYDNIFTYVNHTNETTMDLTMAKTIEGLSAFANSIKPDLIVVHGDRIEALAGAIVGSLNNILVAHIEGGEISGTIDELIRHAVSKLSHIHYVSNHDAQKRLIQMGEPENSIHIIGSPDVDLMLSNALPEIEAVKLHYEIPFKEYAIAMFHPVTTEIAKMQDYANYFVGALLQDKHNYIVIYPNNDMGSSLILNAYKRLENNSRFKIYPSIRFEYFLTLLKNSQFIIGNSSAGIREAPYYGIPTINIGTRQQNRAMHSDILNSEYEEASIISTLNSLNNKKVRKEDLFGMGNSNVLFLDSIKSPEFWYSSKQKVFIDLSGKNEL